MLSMFKILKGLLAVAPKDDIRYYLNGISVKRTGTDDPELHASDGVQAMLITLHKMPVGVTVAPDTDVIIERADLFALMKQFKQTDEVCLRIAPDKVELYDSRRNWTEVRTVDGRYPDVKRAVSVKDPASDMEVGADARLLSDLMKACAIVLQDKRKTPCMRITTHGAHTPIQFKHETDEISIHAALMSVRL